MVKLTWIETKRLFSERKTWIVSILTLLVFIIGVNEYFIMHSPRRTACEAFSFVTTDIFPLFIPVMVGFSTGDMLVKDRRTGILKLYFARNITPLKYILSKVVAGLCSQICLMSAILLLCLALLHVILPYGPAAEYYARFSEYHAFIEQPLLYCIHLILVYILAASAFGSLAIFSSIWIKNGFIVSLVPTFFCFGTLYLLPASWEKWIPYQYLHLGAYSKLPTLSTVIMYWLIFYAVFSIISVAVFCLKQDYD